MSLVNILDTPVVKGIKEDAEKRIFLETGVEVILIVHDKNNLTINCPTTATKDLIKNVVCDVYGIKWAAINTRGRQGISATARQAYIFMLWDLLKIRKTDIAREMNRDHSTIIFAIKMIEGYIKVNDPEAKKIELIKSKINDSLQGNA
jgi:chromosomal replication initiation ATPase DnaA